MRILMHLHLHICIPQVYYYKKHMKKFENMSSDRYTRNLSHRWTEGQGHSTGGPWFLGPQLPWICNNRTNEIFRLYYRDFYSRDRDSSSTKIIRISIIGLNLVILIIEDPLYNNQNRRQAICTLYLGSWGSTSNVTTPVTCFFRTMILLWGETMLYEEFLYVEYLQYDSTAFFILDGVYFLGIIYMADIPIE